VNISFQVGSARDIGNLLEKSSQVFEAMAKAMLKAKEELPEFDINLVASTNGAQAQVYSAEEGLDEWMVIFVPLLSETSDLTYNLDLRKGPKGWLVRVYDRGKVSQEKLSKLIQGQLGS
jgi:hypothetical protein